MKTRLIFLILLIVCYSCATNNKPVSEAQKEKIKGEVKEVVSTFFKGVEEVNFDIAMTPWLDSPDFIYIYNGVSFNYKGVVDAMKPMFSSMINQKITIIDEKYAILDKSTVIYTTNCKFLENYKDGHAVLEDPAIIQIIFRKIKDKWMAINGLESSVRQDVKNSETSKELNQIELTRQFIGSWKCEFAKDTSAFLDYKPYGTGMECIFRLVTRGKTVMEGKQFLGYDKNLDKYVIADMIKGMDMNLYGNWFTSKEKYLFIPFKDISNPGQAPMIANGEFKSPDLFIETWTMNDKILRNLTYSRVK